MKELTLQETTHISGGFYSPAMFQGFVDAALVTFGISVVGAFLLGAGMVWGVQYLTADKTQA